VPHPFLEYTDKMTFGERLWNGFYTVFENLVFDLYHLPKQRALYKKYFPNAKKTFDEMFKGSAIIFLNSHVTSSFPRPYLPNFIDICGIHVKPAKPLPKNLQEFADSGTDGVIIFTMGSFINSKDFPVEKREAIVKSFGKLKQKVIWKYENETLPGNKGNIKISSWLPQRDLIAHKNVKLFITHGGLLGTTEAMSEGVPVLGIPIFGDQKMNMAKAKTRGYGLYVTYDELNEETFSGALNEILSNPKFKENAEIISKRFNDRPMTPQETVVYWTEFAARHAGAPHLRAASNDLNIIQFHSIDVYAFLFIILAIISYINFIVAKFILIKLFRKSASKEKKN
jgi:glucuronosyltransferase